MTKAGDVYDKTGNGFHGIGTDLANGGTFPPFGSIFHFGVTNQTLGQLVIASNGSEPAGGVIGIGDRTKLTPSGTLTGGASFITTEGVGASSVIEPVVRDLYLFGNKNIPIHPFGDPNELNLGNNPVCHAIALDGDAPTVTGCKIFDFRGDGISVTNSTQQISRMARIPRVQGNKISHCWNGIRAACPDTQISGNRVASVRDHCLLVTSGAGNCQSDGNHFFGAQWAIKVESGAGAFKSTNDTFSDAAIGYENAFQSAVSQIVGGFTQHCWLRNILCRAQTSISNTVVRVARTGEEHEEVIGVEFPRDMNGDASRSSFIGGCIYMSDYTLAGDMTPGGSTAGMKIAAWETNVNTAIIGNANYSNEKGIWVPSQIKGGTYYVRASGFTQSGDVIVAIDTETIQGTTWIIECDQFDNAVDIPANWNDSNSILVVRHIPNAPSERTFLNPGQAY